MPLPTVKDVAKKANVSVATVSRVINGLGNVSEKTRFRVLNAIRELEYQPNKSARQLSGGKTFTIGVISPLFTRPAFVERLAGIQSAVQDTGYELVLYSIQSLQQLHHWIHVLATQNRVDGLITISVHVDETITLERYPQLPLVAIDDERTIHYPSVVIDNHVGGKIATEYLIQRGHTSIGFIGDEPDTEFGFVSTAHRYNGFQQALVDAQVPINTLWHRFGAHNRHIADQLARHILSLSDRPSAIVAASDTQAFGIITAARALNLRIPEDIAIIGFDDIEPADYMELTTVRAHMFESGRLAVEYLLEWLGNDDFDPTQFHTVLPMEIIARRTV
jgi:DNA-binding LacI/PurR family transcriptional regulator